MTELEQSILSALDELDTTINSRRAGGAMPNLLPVFSRLDELARELPENSDPELRHFLRRKSYEKARLLLLGRGAENARGACG